MKLFAACFILSSIVGIFTGASAGKTSVTFETFIIVMALGGISMSLLVVAEAIDRAVSKLSNKS